MKWEYEEAILLIDLYYYTKKHNSAENEIAFAALSHMLNNRASQLGYTVEKKFRNITGIKMKLKNIEFLDTKEKKGLSSYSYMDLRCYKFSNENTPQFRKKVDEIKLKYQVKYNHISGNEEKESASETSTHNASIKFDESKGILTFAERFNIDLSNYENIPIRDIWFSVRVTNCLSRLTHINTVADFLRLNISSFAQIKGVGMKCIKEIEEMIAALDSHYMPISIPQKTKKAPIPYLCIANKEKIISGDFSFAKEEDLTAEEVDFLAMYKEGYSILEYGLLVNAYKDSEKVIPIINMFTEYINANCLEQEHETKLLEALHSIPQERWEGRAFGYIRAYSQNEQLTNALLSLCPNHDSSLKSFTYSIITEDDTNFKLAWNFLKWCSFDINEQIQSLFDRLYVKSNVETVVRMRAAHKTLEETGKALGVTRERVRQIEAKAKRNFTSWQSKQNILMKISAIRNGDDVLTPAELQEYFKDRTAEILFLLRNVGSQTYNYDSQLDVFVVGNDTLSLNVQAFVEDLQDEFHQSKLKSILFTAEVEYDLPAEMVEIAIREEFSLTGSTYHRKRLSLTSMYTAVMKKYYANGIKAYDEKELQHFRRIIITEYGEVNLPSNDRAITARISNIGILCGRGIYKPKQERYITRELSHKIYDFINTSNSSIFLMNTIYSLFETELQAEGVKNKYYLQGILKAIYGDKFIFRRDYISKDESVTSVYMEIVQFIKSFQYPVSKKQIYQAYPGITDIVINFAVSDLSIINFFGEYLHVSRLKINEADKLFLEKILIKFISDGEAHHCKEIYDYMMLCNEALLKKLCILLPFSLYSVLEYLYRDQFQFKRPYIAQFDTTIDRPIERLKEYIYSSDKVAIVDVTDFAKENHFQINSILDFFNSYNDEYLLMDKDYIASIEYIGIDDSICKIIEEHILNEVNSCVAISSLSCVYRFPKLNVPWTEWLVYCVLKKWSTHLDVFTTSNQFRMSTPIVVPKGKMDFNVISSIASTIDSGSIIQADDLDDIDNLLTDLIEKEL